MKLTKDIKRRIDEISTRSAKSYLGIVTEHVKDPHLRVPCWAAYFKNNKSRWPLGIGATEKSAVIDLIELDDKYATK